MRKMIRDIMIRLVAPGVIGLPQPGSDDNSTNPDDFSKEKSADPGVDLSPGKREAFIKMNNQ